MTFDHKKIEKKWQKKWAKDSCFKAEVRWDRAKFYALNMFPYPSGFGLHIGHLASYTPTDVVARYKRCRGFNVLNPIGYDAFGLPAEQYAIQTNIHPSIITRQAIDNFRRQLKSFGYSFDWKRELSTCDPDFYKWTQWIFIKFFEKGLAYQKKTPVNWCPAIKTILANEEVVDGKSERGNHPVIKKWVEQWLLAITKYSDRLLEGLKTLDWPNKTIEGQRNWIGKSFGAKIFFSVKNTKHVIEVFTTRPDTLFGVTFMVLSPEHSLVGKITHSTKKPDVDRYKKSAESLSQVARKTSENKTGVFAGAYAIHPFTKKEIPIWIADYVLMDYGTGAVMAVPAHDERDFQFAKKFDLPIKQVIEADKLPFMNEGVHINSDFINGCDNETAIQKIIHQLEQKKCGKGEIQYKLKDWIFSRQRYWGEPFPLVHFKDKVRAVNESELPVELPKTTHYGPSDGREAPLAKNSQFVDYTDPKTGEKGKRDTNTMPGYAGSSWYFLRYTDTKNKKAPFDFEKQKYWMPVDLYVGGSEHTVGHLLYARFWQKVLYDMKLVSQEEPFTKLVHQGMILGEDGQKMSKSRGNVANPDTLQDQYGADAIRVYIIFLGPLEKDKPWSSKGIEGSRRFLDRLWRLCLDEKGNLLSERGEIKPQLLSLLNRTTKKVTEDIENMNLNTAISSMMILLNELYREEVINHKILKIFSQLLMPFAPHLAEEMWSALGGEGFVSLSSWPEYQEELASEGVSTMGVQVNGKMRGTISCSKNTSEAEAIQEAKKQLPVQKALNGRTIKKIIYKPKRILNIVTN